MTCDELRKKLDSYVDSELPASDAAQFEAHLRSCATCASAALTAMKLKHMTRAAAACYSPSPAFRLQMEKQIRTAGKPAWLLTPLPRWLWAATALLLLVASSMLWVNHSERQRAVVELTDLHVATLASANPVDVVSTDRHTVKPWFAGRIPFTFDLPELQNTEFTLIGGRVVYFQHNPAAQLLFGVRQHKISAFIFPENAGGVAPLRASQSTTLAFHSETWTASGLRYFLISDAGAADLHRLAGLLKGASNR